MAESESIAIKALRQIAGMVREAPDSGYSFKCCWCRRGLGREKHPGDHLDYCPVGIAQEAIRAQGAERDTVDRLLDSAFDALSARRRPRQGEQDIMAAIAAYRYRTGPSAAETEGER